MIGVWCIYILSTQVTNQSTPATVADAAALVSPPEAVPKDVSVKKEKKKRKVGAKLGLRHIIESGFSL